MNLSAVFQHLDELLARKAWGEAEEFLKKNLEEAEPDSQAKLTLTNELTELYRRSGKPDAAIPTAEEALLMARRMGYAEAGLYATLLNNAASAYQDAKDYEHALARYQDALDFYTKKNMGASFEAAGIHEAISRVAQAQEQYETALGHQQKALDILEKEKEILKIQAINEGKPEAIAEKMVQGRIKKFYKENCLMDQEFIKDGDQTIKSYTEAKAKEFGGKIEILSFVRYEKGEGIEKRNDDFASEVASMMK